MKNHLLGLSIANNERLKESCIDDALRQCAVVLGESQGIDRCYVLEIEKHSINYYY